MAKYLIKASYTEAGAKGLLKEGAASRRTAVEKAVQAAGGRLEAFYFAYGETDAFVVCDMPDATAAIALSLNVNASGAVKIATIPLITVEEIDAACKKSVAYRAPGS